MTGCHIPAGIIELIKIPQGNVAVGNYSTRSCSWIAKTNPDRMSTMKSLKVIETRYTQKGRKKRWLVIDEIFR
jgi:hypothetical protein